MDPMINNTLTNDNIIGLYLHNIPVSMRHCNL